jgi:arginine decarboxylase-like protein
MTKKAMIESLISKGIDKPRIPLEALSKAELIAALRDVLRH